MSHWFPFFILAYSACILFKEVVEYRRTTPLVLIGFVIGISALGVGSAEGVFLFSFY